MSATALRPHQLRLNIDPSNLSFSDTRALADQPLPWIGQQRAEQAARFGLTMQEDHANLFVIDEVGSGCASLLHQMVREVAALRPAAPDLCGLVKSADPTPCQVLHLPAGQPGAPVIVEEHPSQRRLFGRVQMPPPGQAAASAVIEPGSLLRANGGFLLLHLRDLLVDQPLWEQFYRWLRSAQVPLAQQDADGCARGASTSTLLVESRVKVILFGTRAQYEDLQHEDPAWLDHFQVLVDFSESFTATPESYQATAVFIARTCEAQHLPHYSAAAVARLLELSHRLAEDQRRQSANFGRFKRLLMESALYCQQRQGHLVEAQDVEQCWQERRHRHDYPQQRLCEAVAEGEMLISVAGQQVGQVNGLTIIDLGEQGFGFPVRVTARTHAGEEGLINIDHEVAMSGPIHDKGVLILHSYLAALFAHNAPLSFNASIVFEQEYHGIEGDSASCAELFALISALAGVPFHQGIAVTGALNQHGEMLPVGGINEKIEGYFRVCATLGLTGHQGVLLPRRNTRHLMLDAEVVAAVDQGLFHLYVVDQVIDGLELLSGMPTGQANGGGNYPRASLLGAVQQTLLRYQRICQAPTRHRAG